MIQFRCECGRGLQARDEDAGRQSKCPACGCVSVIPQPESIKSAGEPERDRDWEEEPDRKRRTRSDAVQAGEPDERPRSRRRDEDDDYEDDRHYNKPEATSGKAITALVLGLMSFVCAGLPGLPAIIVGALAMRDIGKRRGRLGGKGMALTGIITGAMGIFMVIPFVLIALLLPAVQKVREAAARMQDANNLKQMSLAMMNFHDTYGAYPQAAAFRSKDGKPLLSWRVAILPFIEQQNLYQQFKLDEPWDSPNNIRLVGMIPKVYLQPGEVSDGRGLTHYQVFAGPGTIFDDQAAALKKGRKGGPGGFGNVPGAGQPRLGLSITDIADGTSNTILIATASNPVPWTKPEDLPFGPGVPLPALGGVLQGNNFNVAFADGSVKPIAKNAQPSLLKAAITRNGGENVNLP
jgi:prepilin-type processing-associated H-X9-DG protein